MKKFKVGDRVRLIGEAATYWASSKGFIVDNVEGCRKDNYSVTLDLRTSGPIYNLDEGDLELDELYYTPLAQAMRE